MKIRRTFHTIDTHTGGEPTRNVVGGIPVIPGSTMEEKMMYMREHCDWIRELLTYEPRGNDVMSGTIITTPCREDADVGVLYFEVGDWMPMCGHDTIGVGTALVESGMVKVTEPYTYVNLDTPAGLVRLKIQVKDCKAQNVTFINAPAFVLKKDAKVKSSRYGELVMDEVNSQVEICHPLIPFENKVTHIEFYEPAEAPGEPVRNAVVIPPGAIDRSPCGTGTSAKLSVLALKGEIKKGEAFVHESIIGSRFTCRYLEDARVGDYPAVVPEVTGRAWVTGIHTFMLDDDDPFVRGFQLR